MTGPEPTERTQTPPPGDSAAPPLTTPPPTPPTPPPTWQRPPAEHGRNASLILGLIVLVIGAWFFATRTLGLDLPDLDWDQLWPIILIVIGGWIVYSSFRRAR